MVVGLGTGTWGEDNITPIAASLLDIWLHQPCLTVKIYIMM